MLVNRQFLVRRKKAVDHVIDVARWLELLS
jgi:hypothetical protein